MQHPPDHPDETARIAALDALDHVDTPAERRFDVITESARSSLEVPIALVSLIHRDRQWFKSAQGLSTPETDRCVSFCGHAILGDEIFEIPDAAKDPRFDDNPLVTGPPHIRFYAGMPARAPNGLPLGTLCILDTEPRELSAVGRKRLKALTRWLEMELQNRGLTSRELSTIVQEGRGREEGWLDAPTRCWNLEAGRLLLAGLLERSQPLDEKITVGVIQLILKNTTWESLAENGHDEEIRFKLANLLRSDYSAGVTFFAEAPDFLFFMSNEPGQLQRLPDLAGIGRLLRLHMQSQHIAGLPSLHGAICHVGDGAGRQKENILQQLRREAGRAGPGDVLETSL